MQSRYIAAGFADLAVSKKSTDNWYCLLRKVQSADALPFVLDGMLNHQVDSTEFEKDILFCEWTYFVDWTNKKVHVSGGTEDRVKTFGELSEDWMGSLQPRNLE